MSAREHFRRWAGSLLAGHGGRHGHGGGVRIGHRVDGGTELDGALFQTSTVGALLDGVYDGEVTINELLGYGDFGLGTFNRLDGEMVVLDGVCYHLRSDGSATVASGDERTPFAAVIHFRAQQTISVRGRTDRASVLAEIDRATRSRNLSYAIRVDGRFRAVRTRTAMAQHEPYPPLTEATAHVPITEFTDVTGTLVGFRTPDFEQGISVAGYHLHFLDIERDRGGHCLDFDLEHGSIALCSSSELHLSLPRTDAFLAAELNPADADEQIRRVEG
jgi:acetolactate decarboxylase